MNEEFLSYLWKYRQLDPDLVTESGEALTVLNPGEQNRDGGPDFFNARLRIGETTWAGNVEIHVCASHWFRHGHQHDHAYDNAILHVVYENDQPVVLPNGMPLQTLVVRDRFPVRIFKRYQLFMNNHQWIPCYNQLSPAAGDCLILWAPALTMERLINKSLYIKQMWNGCRKDWEEAFYQHMASTFGFKINSLPFELLAKSLPMKIVRRHTGDLLTMEALAFGQAGMLGRDFTEEYPRGLSQEYRYLQKKYSLTPITESTWKFLRLRPVNFPTLRISQWACFLSSGDAAFSRVLEKTSCDELSGSLQVSASPYWDTHYTFEKTSAPRKKILGRSCVDLMMINGIAPFLFFYGLEKDEAVLREKALDCLEKVRGEQNADVAHWQQTGLETGNALRTQALIQLKRSYCDKRRCLDCRIGNALLSTS